MAFINWIIREGKAILILTLYFLFCYGTIVLLKKLILAGYQISYFGMGAAVVGALISAKAVLLIECTPLAKVLATARPVLKVLFDAFVYTLIALLFLYLEKVIEVAHKEGSVRLAFTTVGHDDHTSLFLATVIWAGLAFLGYAVISAINRHLGRGELYRIFFTPPAKKDAAAANPPPASAE